MVNEQGKTLTTFENLEVGQTFILNKNVWYKRSSRTAGLASGGPCGPFGKSWCYFGSKDIVTV